MFDGKPPISFDDFRIQTAIFLEFPSSPCSPGLFPGMVLLSMSHHEPPKNGQDGRMTTNLPYLGFYLWARCALDDPKSNLSRENIRGMFHTCVGMAEINSAANRGIVGSTPQKKETIYYWDLTNYIWVSSFTSYDKL